jgi:hypothetical protein
MSALLVFARGVQVQLKALNIVFFLVRPLLVSGARAGSMIFTCPFMVLIPLLGIETWGINMELSSL